MAFISSSILDIAEILKQSDIAAIPTETVYGLAGNAYDQVVLKKIFELKQRPFFNPLIVHIKSATDLDLVAAHIPPQAQLLANTFWPGPLTLVLKKQTHILDLVTAGKDTVAVRVPNHPVALELLQQLDFPLAAPSANPFSSISPTKATHVANYFEHTPLPILEGGECSNGIESTIIGFENDVAVLYRMGSIPIEAIEKVIGPLKIKTQCEATPAAPGMLSKHYAPKTTTIQSDTILESIHANTTKRIGLLSFKNRFEHESIVAQKVLSAKGDLAEAAACLYDALHELDQLQLDIIIAERFPEQHLGRTINDRLARATKK
ncbi:L-threonylcarbamoyladenylate synthase [Flavobacterium sp. 14A]|uniref:L-threonylcarbamoyladenylate synthase n=1 Tax=Flavobacterium sp. 14A TaxID=2735896 RepID=UPI00156E4111|nr:L-threonylcarbamoyladenylate synthase [Flavobacterium sp. 14A]NRT13218.1 L-threonylcarbamoyladenylate synthase [Flavobacterium sp. 14A]